MLDCNGILSEVGGGMGMRQCMYEWMVCMVGLERNEEKEIYVIPMRGSYTSSQALMKEIELRAEKATE